MTESSSTAPSSDARSLLRYSKTTYAIYLIVLALILMIVSMIAARMLHGLAEHPEMSTDETPAFAVSIINHPYLFGLSLLPAAAFGVLALVMKRARTVCVALGTLALIIPPVLLIASFVVLIAPMYQPQSL